MPSISPQPGGSREGGRPSPSRSRSRSLSRGRTRSDDDDRSPSRSKGSPRRRKEDRSTSRSLSRSRSPSRSRSRSRSRHRSRSRSRSRSRAARRSLSPRSSAKRTAVHIQGLTKMVHERHLVDIFEEYGDVRDVVMPRYSRSGENRTVAHVVYSSAASASKAAEHMNLGQIDGAVVSVEACAPPRPPRADRARERGYGAPAAAAVSRRGYGRERDWAERDSRGSYDRRQEGRGWGGWGEGRGYGPGRRGSDWDRDSDRRDGDLDARGGGGGDDWRAEPRPARSGRWAAPPPARSRSRSPVGPRMRSMSIDDR